MKIVIHDDTEEGIPTIYLWDTLIEVEGKLKVCAFERYYYVDDEGNKYTNDGTKYWAEMRMDDIKTKPILNVFELYNKVIQFLEKRVIKD